MTYNITKKVNLSFEEAVLQLKDKLANEGFGILTEIDVQNTLKKKIDVDFEKYIILGACNPPFAYKALKAEHEIGLLLPCNVIVYEKGNNVHVSAINPIVGMGFIDNDDLRQIAKEITTKLKLVMSQIN